MTRIELVESSGPMAPRHRFETRIVVDGDGDRAGVERWHDDAGGAQHTRRELGAERWRALEAAVAAALPPGEHLDLVGDKRRNKGVAPNHVTVEIDGRVARLDYLLSHLDEEFGDPRARALVGAIKGAAAG